MSVASMQIRKRPKTAIWVKVIASLLMAVVSYVALARPSTAQTSAQIDALIEALNFDEMVSIIADESRDLGDADIEGAYGVSRAAYQDMVDRLFAEAPMQVAFRAELTEALKGAEIDPMIAFYKSPLGQKVSMLELETRRAFSEQATQDAAAASWAALDPDTSRAQLIEDFVKVGDLIELNVVGSLNNDIAYYRGLSQSAGGDGQILSEDDLMASIWASEPDVRADISEWVYGYSAMAYAPLSDEELQAYIDFIETPAGQRLNLAMFTAFDGVFDAASVALGAATGQLLANAGGDEL
ncbi:DUF2059 domain-containing protein [Celeribacter arenosi]|uniref:DUF2059 domain-containing protein n=1 Tax=Celeribacter arenosi TaxID=792649 RepID=UPI0031D07B44